MTTTKGGVMTKAPVTLEVTDSLGREFRHEALNFEWDSDNRILWVDEPGKKFVAYVDPVDYSWAE